jgi:1-acyl-sn-glycerol-3-phosphate acyltransferase
MSRILKLVFFGLIVKPLVFIGLGLNIRGKKNLPQTGPAVIGANHNSHLDTLVLMALYPLTTINKVRPVAAADYFLRNAFLAWFSLNIIGIIPLERKGRERRTQLFSDCHDALDRGEILLVFPEGSRGKPEEISELKKGVYYLIHDRSDTELTPVLMQGLGHALPKGEALFVPCNCDVIIGHPLQRCQSAQSFLDTIIDAYKEMRAYCITTYLGNQTEHTIFANKSVVAKGSLILFFSIALFSFSSILAVIFNHYIIQIRVLSLHLN